MNQMLYLMILYNHQLHHHLRHLHHRLHHQQQLNNLLLKNLLNFLTPMIQDGQLAPDWDDEVIADSALTHAGEIRHAPTRALVEGEAS